MKSVRLRLIILLLTLFLILFSFAGCSGCISWGSPLIDILIENQTNQILSIYIFDRTPLGNVTPGQQIIANRVDMNISEYPIFAKNVQGEIVFSETFTYNPKDKYHLIETDLKHQGVVKVYKAVIPPLQSK